MKLNTIALAVLTTLLLSGCDFKLPWGGGDTYTLYRGNLATGNLRMHVATFDAADPRPEYAKSSQSYNYENCARTARLYQGQAMLATDSRFWCEKGCFRK